MSQFEAWQISQILSHKWNPKNREYEFLVSWIDKTQDWDPSYIREHNFMSEAAQDTLNEYILNNNITLLEPPEDDPLLPPRVVNDKPVRYTYGEDFYSKEIIANKFKELCENRSILEIVGHGWNEDTHDVFYAVRLSKKPGDTHKEVIAHIDAEMIKTLALKKSLEYERDVLFNNLELMDLSDDDKPPVVQIGEDEANEDDEILSIDSNEDDDSDSDAAQSDLMDTARVDPLPAKRSKTNLNILENGEVMMAESSTNSSVAAIPRTIRVKQRIVQLDTTDDDVTIIDSPGPSTSRSVLRTSGGETPKITNFFRRSRD